MYKKRKGLQLRGATFGDPKHRETLFTVSRHCDLYEKRKSLYFHKHKRHNNLRSKIRACC